MVKIDTVIGLNIPLQENSNGKTPNPRLETERPGSDSVTISEEGKKRRIMGHVFASLSDGRSKGRY